MMEVKIALAGNPNAGKTTIFNALTGARQKVGNYPGVTVERKEGFLRLGARCLRVIDLPGTYSLTSYSPEEIVAREVIVRERPEVVVDVVDASNLERNLYLTVQLFELGVPVIVVLNMMDDARARGVSIDLEKLGRRLGVPVVATVAHRGEGLEALRRTLEAVLSGRQVARPAVSLAFPPEIQRAVEEIEGLVRGHPGASDYPARWLAVKALEGDEAVWGLLERCGLGEAVEEVRARLRQRLGEDPEPLIAEARYRAVREMVSEAVSRRPRETLSDRLDAVVCHRWLGLPIFFLVMAALFQAVFAWSAPFTDLIEGLFARLGEEVEGLLGPGPLRSLLVDGVIAGVGGVLVFLPQILVLFFLISLLEDSGYMPRAAFVVDRLLRPFGLSGKSFVPLLSSFACNIPGILATRTIENRAQRVLTALAAPFMSCSARLPVFTLFIAAFVPERKVLGVLELRGLVLLGVYLAGVAAAALTVVLLKPLVLRGSPAPFLMELPPYRLPTLRNLLLHMWTRAVLYLRKAGTVILAISVVMWALFTFPQGPEAGPEALTESYAGRFGRLIEPALRPLGFDWRVGIALTSAFAAKEVLVSTLGQIYSLGEEVEGTDPSLIEHIRRDPVFNPVTGLGLVLFTLLMVPCMATLPVMRLETGHWGWPLLSVVWSTALAWTVTFLWVRVIGPLVV